MNRIERYVRSTIKEAAKGYTEAGYASLHPAHKAMALKEATKAALSDATRGTDTGWWNGLIYTRDVYRMAAENRKAIAEAVTEFLSEVGDTIGERPNRSPDTPTYGAILAACSLAPSFKEWEGTTSNQMEREHGRASEAYADALMFGLRFAVEWYAGKMAREHGL